MFFLLLACGSGSDVTLTSAPLPDLPLPGTLAAVTPQVQRPLEACYRKALATDSALKGSVRAEASGSHGVIKVVVDESAPPALAGCMRETLTGRLLARELVDGNVIVGVVFTARFGG